MGTFVIDGKLKVNGDGTEVGVLTVNGGSLATNLTNSTSNWEQGHYFFVNDASAGGFGAAGTGAAMNLFWVGTKDQPWCSISSDRTLTATTLKGKLDWSYIVNAPTVTAGNGLTGGGTLSGNITISHIESSVTSLTANGRKYVTGLTFDAFGHVTGYTTGTETIVTPTFTNKDVTLAWGTESTIATVGGVDITLTMPANPNTDTYGRTVNTTSRIYLMGGLSQNNSNKATYSNVSCYAEGGYLYSGGTKVSVDGHTHSGYALTDGSNATGTWPVSITGTAGAVAWGNVTGKPTTFTPATHNHNDLYETKGTAAATAELAITALRNELLNGAGDAYDTLKELGVLIDANRDAIDALEEIGGNKVPKTTKIIAGEGLTGGGALSNDVTLSHAVPTSVATSLTANGRKYVTGLTFDKFGHVTGYTTGTETVADSNSAHSHSAGVGLALGSTVTGGTSGTVNYKAKLRSETALTVDSAAATTTSGRVYPVVVDKSGYLAVNVPWTNVNSGYATTSGSNASGTWPISISGNAASASSVAWGNVTGKPSSYTPSAHVHDYINFMDTRSVNQSPDEVQQGLSVHLKSKSVDGLDGGGSYHAVLNVKDWHDYSGGPYWQASAGADGNLYYRHSTSGTTWGAWRKVWAQGDAITSAVWNDYAEYRESDCENAGYVLFENGNDTLSKTTERLQHFAGISSDTWGFSQGETENAKTPIAVAGRVLAYTYRDRNEYKPGDCVCAAPDGTVDIMTREEVINWPDRIVGTVSCVPEYDTWGGGENADRPPVQVNGRIWIKIK